MARKRKQNASGKEPSAPLFTVDDAGRALIPVVFKEGTEPPRALARDEELPPELAKFRRDFKSALAGGELMDLSAPGSQRDAFLLGASTPPPIEDKDWLIVDALRKAAPLTLTEERITAVTDLSVRTIQRRLIVLRNRGWTWRPNGRKGGETLTPDGLEAANRLS